MMAKEPKEQLPRVFTKGTRVEICPFRDGYCFIYLQGLDGERGTVTGVAGHGEHMKVGVKLDGQPHAVGHPVQALKPISEDT